MGYWSERQIYEGEMRFHAEPGKRVCEQCVSEPALRRVVSENLTESSCDFCSADGEGAIAADADLVLEHISRSLRREYADPNGLLYYDDEEQRWIGASVYDFDEVLWDAGCSELGEDAFDAFVRSAFLESEWCSDPCALTEVEALQFSWSELCRTVKHRQRFFFGSQHEKEENNEPGWPILVGGEMLDRLGDLIREYGLVVEWNAGKEIHRARDHLQSEHYEAAKDLGAPPPESASQSRMSPAGISSFYGAEDADTALIEVANLGASSDMATVGKWRITETCRIVDLDRVPAVPSPFDDTDEAIRARPPLGFLNGFRLDVTRPIKRDNRIHIDYVPTQVVAEYLRYVFRDADNRTVHGVAWRSGHDGGGKNVALFLDQDRCVEEEERPPLLKGLLVELTGSTREPIAPR